MDYFKLGWAVFPCHGKIPATPHGFKQAVKTQIEFDELIRKYPAANIGIATGQVSGIWILDIDIKKGAKGEESLAALIAKHGPLPSTVTARTWSGGTHYFFKSPPSGIGNRTNVFAGIDVRGSGGYIIAPPSTIDGKRYEWITAPGNGTPIADAPAWLLNILKSEKVDQVSTDGMIVSGGRNSELTSRAGKMRAAGMEADDIFMALLKFNATRCSPPLPEKEVRVIAESVGRYAAAATNAPLTDLWNSERFVEKYGEDIKWCERLGGWHTWDGRAWRRQDETTLMAYAKSFVKDLGRQAQATDDKRVKAHAVKSESAGKLSAIVELAKSEVCLDALKVDHNDTLLNCANGTLDLKTGTIRPAERNDLLTKCLSIDYNPGAECPIWLNFLREIFQNDNDLIEYVQRAVGYCLTGLTTEQKFFLCVGNGRNGKSTFLKHLTYILAPDYASGTPAQTMLESDGNTLHAIASLKGMRLVVLNEFDEGKTLSSAQVKNLTGGEPVVARHLYHEQFTYTPTYKFWLTTNFKPRIKDTSLGIWRRLVVIPFDFTVPADKVDHDLDAKLTAEYPGILAWAVQGCQKWLKSGLPALSRLQDVASAYQGDSDVIGQFLEETLDTEANPAVAKTSLVELIKAFGAWGEENGIRYLPGRASILDYMDKKGYGRPKIDNTSDYRGARVFTGISLLKKGSFFDGGKEAKNASY